MLDTIKFYGWSNYDEIYECSHFDRPIQLSDHLNGFSSELTNPILDHIQDHSSSPITVYTEYVFEREIVNRYSNLKFQWTNTWVNDCFQQYNIHPTIDYKNFVCSFNGSAHVSRILLVAILKRFNYFESEYCSKNFKFTTDVIDGHVSDYFYMPNCHYRKFFIANDSDDFFDTIYSFGHVRFDHKNNIYNLEEKLANSFLHIVSESMATSYWPFVTEKFLYSVITRGLFLAYAHPGWHEHLEKCYGFKRYTKLFDYRFDSIQNPVERLVELMSMISKFSVLSFDDWRDLYLLEQDTIEYNYNHYFSGDYLKCLKQYE